MTTETRLDRERELFDLCMQHAPAEWPRVLERHCDDSRVRERVTQLLERHRNTETMDTGFLRLDPADPERIGPYRILQRLGEGGMGIVYAAEQREPVRRRVAIKVLRSGASSREVLARFDVERQAMSLMTHANIARILDAGTTVDHRPFIAMEFVPGEPIVRYCEQRQLGLRERLALFRTVCEAVQHAHQKGVIHRDLKPSNILVMEEDGRPLPKVIDFGIAKAVTQRLTDRTLETHVGSLLGTPDYMSPEQAEASPLDVDTRADVYALGAVLYELLTSEPPLGLAGTGKTFLEMQRCIREVEPPLPSSRAKGELQRTLRGELDWIVQRALEKDRNRRYATAAELAADVGRYLAGEVPLAGPHSLAYLAQKFVHRHALAVGVATGAFVLLAAFSGMMAWQVQQTELERDRANLAAKKAQEVTDFIVQTFQLADPGEGKGADVTARQLLDAGLERVRAQLDDQPEVRAELLQTLSSAYTGLGEYIEGEQLAREALELLRSADSAGNTAMAQAHLGDVLILRGQYAEAESLLQQSLQDGTRCLPPAGEDLQTIRVRLAKALLALNRVDEAESLLLQVQESEQQAGRTDGPMMAAAVGGLADVAIARGDMEAAERWLRESILLLESLHGGQHIDVRIRWSTLADVLRVRGDIAGAEKIARAELEKTIAMLGPEHPDVAASLNNIGLSVMQQKRYAEAAELYQRAHEVTARTKGAQHPDTLTILHNLAIARMYAGDAEQAAKDAREILVVLPAIIGDEHPGVASVWNTLANALRLDDRPEEALPVARSAVARFTQALGANHWKTANARKNLGRVLLDLAKHEEAEQELRLARTDLGAALGEDNERVRDVDDALATLFDRTNRRIEAETIRSRLDAGQAPARGTP